MKRKMKDKKKQIKKTLVDFIKLLKEKHRTKGHLLNGYYTSGGTIKDIQQIAELNGIDPYSLNILGPSDW